ncbi:2,3-bisphosphoglycerate-independent phosphoglycerate mutase [Ammonifex thiophilus]|uniref:2,3-bisphosphoglycerate-independent phosphoglycerate mutase n=1 Tax=Ammonifex thiophilus TaxID=444093 RepID=A0A3D8P2V8_9THEO|nr:2,3-bisphosphoglycerate-independent phosphoglycerate mutase [Ammonifex thiophilus]RDV82934.1 2,3-bisphosphoglycerate-independent phosphoglycerate mutase [Ammonifex thiophilus]
MDQEKLLEELVHPADTKMVLVVLDGLGGLPLPEREGKTELEAAHKPNLDALARVSELGLAHPVLPGITPGSSAGHLALFGYDPIKYVIGRGVLEALGIDFPLEPGDIAIRGNFATARFTPQGPIIVDRRAGRPSTEHTASVCRRLQEKIQKIEDVEVLIRPVKEHRFVVVFRGPGLDPRVADTDPQEVEVPPLPPQPLVPEAEKTARLATIFLNKLAEVLQEEPATNFALLRGFSQRPHLKLFGERFRLKAAAIALYPMYRGLAALVGMEVLPVKEESLAYQLAVLRESWPSYDFFFFHVKATDSRGEDGDWEGKIKVIEEFDRYLPQIMELKPDVLVITGDHSTPALHRAHSWHPVPYLLYSRWARYHRDTTGFGERDCAQGALGHFPLLYNMNLMLAHAHRLAKFSA